MDCYSNIRKQIVEIGKRMYDKNFVASNDGNISVRLSDNRIMITPSGVSKGFMKKRDLCIIDMSGNIISAGAKKPSSEYKIHLEVYRKRPEIYACVHAHPQKATAFAVAGLKFDKLTLPEVIFSLGSIELAEYATPSSEGLSERVAEKISYTDALLLANHGALTIGSDLEDAYYKMETLEHFAAITIYARILGGERALPETEKAHLFEIRKNVFGKAVPLCKENN